MNILAKLDVMYSLLVFSSGRIDTVFSSGFIKGRSRHFEVSLSTKSKKEYENHSLHHFATLNQT